MGVLILAITCGGFAAVATLITSQSVLMALAVYSGVGVVSVLGLISVVAAQSALRGRTTGLLGTDATPAH